MNQFMMNQFAAAVNNKNNGMDAQIGFPGTQQGMINPQTLMYQNQLMYQVCKIFKNTNIETAQSSGIQGPSGPWITDQVKLKQN